MRINPILLDKATFDPSKESNSVKIETLCEDIKRDKITIPIFQTYVRWTLQKSISLLNFQLLGYAAVSPISINIIDEEDNFVPQVRFITRDIVDSIPFKSFYSVNDGQQRLTCNYKAYIDHQDFRSVVLDISKGRFIENSETIKNNQIPVGKLYNGDSKVFDEYIKQHKSLQKLEVMVLLQRIRNKFLSYYYIVNYAKNLTRTEQMNWFEVLNLAGSRVTSVQISLTDLLIKGVDFYRDYAIPLSEKFEQYDFQDLFVFKATEISIPLALLNPGYEKHLNQLHKSNFSPIPSDAKPNLFGKVDDKVVVVLFQEVLSKLDLFFEFLDKEGIKDLSRIEQITFIIGALIFNNINTINEFQSEKIKVWLEETDFTNKGNTDRRLIFDSLLNNLKTEL